ncbi:MAG TPA: hypothetical protein VFP47_09520, partial [Pyrinomonadaceae bacterium]|nr:hypothetical protein [Pyrinomonadaceae bacterium]
MIRTLMMLILSLFLGQTAFSQVSSAPKTSVVAKSDGGSETNGMGRETKEKSQNPYSSNQANETSDRSDP